MYSLIEILDLKDPSPVEQVFENPISYNLKNVPKISQTDELVRYACSNDGMALGHVSKKLITQELCEIAVEQNGFALRHVPDKIIDESDPSWYKELCKTAVSQNGVALNSVREDYKSKELVEMAIFNENNPDEYKYSFAEYPIAFVPFRLMTDDLLLRTVERFPLSLKSIPERKKSDDIIKKAVSNNSLAIKYVPEEKKDKDLAEIALSKNPMAIEFVPDSLIDEETAKKLFKRECAVLPFINERYVTEEMCLEVIEQNKLFIRKPSEEKKEQLFGTTNVFVVLFDDLPESLRNSKRIIDRIIEKDPQNALLLEKWQKDCEDQLLGDRYRSRRAKQLNPLRPSILKSITKVASKVREEKDKADEDINKQLNSLIKNRIELNTPSTESIIADNMLPCVYEGEANHDLSTQDKVDKIFYISDIHIEHQLSEELKKQKDLSYSENIRLIYGKIREKIDEMLEGITSDRNSVLLIGGDVADSSIVSGIFYDILRDKWMGLIISILGNHELWDGTSEKEWKDPTYIPRAIDEIIEEYKKGICSGKKCARKDGKDDFTGASFRNHDSIMLHNSLYILYKNRFSRIINENEINEATDKELTDILEKCSLIILGGIGFSGLNNSYNFDCGLYRRALSSREEDIIQTDRFRRVYDKIIRCAKDKRVIVFTHNPVSDWTTQKCNNTWIYVNGHTHINSARMTEDGEIILSDNQIGYTPQKWRLHSFEIDQTWYDPFMDYSDGIYKVTSEEYRQFNLGRGIMCNGLSYNGTLYMLKKNDTYMFLLESAKSLCLMSGGRRTRLATEDVQYYYDNLDKYTQNIKCITAPYQATLKKIAEEVKRFGGVGRIHGCIVDISFFSHIYLNPFDGKITPYWAPSVTSRITFKNVENLLMFREIHLLDQYLSEKRKGSFNVLVDNENSDPKKSDSVSIPQWMFGTEIYKASGIMKTIQYVWEQNVVRIWNDEILTVPSELSDKKKGISEQS